MEIGPWTGVEKADQAWKSLRVQRPPLRSLDVIDRGHRARGVAFFVESVDKDGTVWTADIRRHLSGVRDPDGAPTVQ